MATVETSTVILPRKPQGAFRNEPFVDFSQHENARAMRGALARVGDELGHEYPLSSAESACALSEDRVAQSVAAGAGRGRASKGGGGTRRAGDAGRLKALRAWKFAPVEERASLLLGAARSCATASSTSARG